MFPLYRNPSVDLLCKSGFYMVGTFVFKGLIWKSERIPGKTFMAEIILHFAIATRRCSVKKVFWEILQNSQENT